MVWQFHFIFLMSTAQDGILYTSIPLGGLKNESEMVALVDDLVGKKFFSINSGSYLPFSSISAAEIIPDEAGLQGVIASCDDGCYSVHTELIEKLQENM